MSATPPCAPSRAEILQRIREQEGIFGVAHREFKAGNEEVAMLLYGKGEQHWDDAIHIQNPRKGRESLCGLPFRNLVALDGQWPDSGSGCWTCLLKAESFQHATSVGAA